MSSKTWDTGTTPTRIDALPRDERRGLPIPFANQKPDGTADFAVVDGLKAIMCATHSLCGVCGQSLGYWVAFLGGPRSLKARTYLDPPMHEDCALSSVRLCPHIARRAPHRSAKVEHRPDVVTPAGFVEDKPSEWWVGVTRSFSVTSDSYGGPIYRAAAWKRKHGFNYDDNGMIQEMING